MPIALTPNQLQHALARRDLTDPEAGSHALQMLVDIAVDALAQTWRCDVRRAPGPRIVPLEDNYDRLRYPPADVTRDARYTRYIDDGRVLRSHSSAMIPPALARLADDPVDDILLVCPGITYRRDAIDRLHTGAPHQLDLWRITRWRIGEADLEKMLHLLVDALAPGRAWRWEPRVHPYTLTGRQIDVRNGEEWVEVWECGLARFTISVPRTSTGGRSARLQCACPSRGPPSRWKDRRSGRDHAPASCSRRPARLARRLASYGAAHSPIARTALVVGRR